MIYLSLEIPENFLRLFLLDGFLVVCIPLVYQVEFKFLAQFLPHSVVSSFIIFFALVC